MKQLRILVLLLGVTSLAQGQVGPDKVVGKKNAAVIDSIKKTAYPYILPIWGAKAAARGFDLPYSAGLGVNYFAQQSDLVISDLFVGFNNGPTYDLDEVVRFDDAISTASAYNIRPDLWVLPFLNVYGIFTKARTSTEISAGLWVPDVSNVWKEVASFSTKVNFDVTGVGIGATPTIGVGGGWMAFDMNRVWTDVTGLDKPVVTTVFGPRMGKSFKLKKPERNFTAWVGGFRLQLSSSTNGSLPLADVVPTDGLQAKVDNGQQKVSDTQAAVDSWWNGLPPAEQARPGNIAKYETANRALEKTGSFLNSMDAALNDGQGATVQYSLAKRPKDAWNFLVGSQYQFNKNYMVRLEYGFLGSRQQVIAGLQYRFGL